MNTIDSWPAFGRQVRSRQQPLLAALGQFPDAVLVAGCQRSGTTLLAQVIGSLPGFAGQRITGSAELDAALILAAAVAADGPGRRCFQTTYLNQSWGEYRNLGPEQRLLWVLRRPDSVLWSMTRHWKRRALNNLYLNCGQSLAATWQSRWQQYPAWQRWYRRYSYRAALAYAGKLNQLPALRDWLGDRLLVLDYDDLVRAPEPVLRRVCDFIGAPFAPACLASVHAGSLHRAETLSRLERDWLAAVCEPVYRRELEHPQTFRVTAA